MASAFKRVAAGIGEDGEATPCQYSHIGAALRADVPRTGTMLQRDRVRAGVVEMERLSSRQQIC